jgi:addiction module RelB/DinJ family antitoxin
MNNRTIRARIDKKTKEKAEKVLKGMGLNISTAIRMYLKHLVKKAQKNDSKS